MVPTLAIPGFCMIDCFGFLDLMKSKIAVFCKDLDFYLLHSTDGISGTCKYFSQVSVSDFGASSVLDRGAIELCARKVASATGDARKALELCRKAIEVVQREATRQYEAMNSMG